MAISGYVKNVDVFYVKMKLKAVAYVLYAKKKRKRPSLPAKPIPSEVDHSGVNYLSTMLVYS